MTQKRRPQPRSRNVRTRTTRSRKGVGTSFLSRLSHISIWGYLLAVVVAIALYCFVLFYFFVDPYSFQWKAIYGETTYPEGYEIRGIDVSHYQQEIRWEKLRNASMGTDPVTFVIIKATEGESIIDEYFNDNFYQAYKNDFVRGAYHFLTPDVTAERQARFFIRQVHLEVGDLPPVLDVEDERKWRAAGYNNAQIQKKAADWLRIVEQHYGVAPIIYSGYKFHRDILSDSIFDRYPRWIAHYYVDKPRDDVRWAFWQHTDCGKIKGIRGSVDCNIFNGDMDALNAILIH